VGLIAGADGGSSKTELLVATTEGEVVALVRGPGSNSHDVGADGCIAVLTALWEESGAEPVDRGAFFLCGADLPSDIAELAAAVAGQPWVRAATIDNDTFALLRAGTDDPDAIAVICGAGINCVGRRADGRIARYPSLGWETGDWGGGYMLSREALFLASRAVDGRGEATALAAAIGDVAAYAEAVHYRRAPLDLAPLVLEVAEAGDAVALGLVERQAEEIALLARRALADLDLDAATIVVGGGLVRGILRDQVEARIGPVVVPRDAPVVGAALAALDAAGAPPQAGARLREALR
jgi:N-acetylglucosamine kinase-like BadF-type ATPase